MGEFIIFALQIVLYVICYKLGVWREKVNCKEFIDFLTIKNQDFEKIIKNSSVSKEDIEASNFVLKAFKDSYFNS